MGTATSGTDHVDRAWLRKQGIRFAHARGANAESVVDYVIAALFRLAVRRGESLSGRKVGIVGCGHVGGGLAGRLRALGLDVLLRDPPRDRHFRARGAASPFVSMERILAESDIISLHTPLNRHGRDATHHLVDTVFLQAMRPGSWLVNTARGPVVDAKALETAWSGRGALVLDVWENEPRPTPSLVSRADLATAHIAGYALDAKLEATRRMARAVARFLGVAWKPPAAAARTPVPIEVPGEGASEAEWLDALVRRMYPIERDDASLRAVVRADGEMRGTRFEALRRDYPVRRAFSSHTVHADAVPESLRRQVFSGLGLVPAGKPAN